jgi:Gnt-I system high-affinity gluconate transporter
MQIALVLIAILILIILVSWVKLDTFISFLIVAIGLGIANHMGIPAIGSAIKKGIGDTLGDLALIVGFGAMLGKIVSHSGAAEVITNKIVGFFGEKYLIWGLALAGFIIGIPLFYNAGFIIVVPLIFSIVNTTRLPLMYLAIPMLSALSVAHGYLPPHPSPALISSQIGAELGKTLLYGIIVAIPAIIVAGPIFGSTLKNFKTNVDTTQFTSSEKITNPPSTAISFTIALLPVFMLTFFAVIKSSFVGNTFMELLAEPYVGMMLSVLAAIYFLEIRRGNSLQNSNKLLEDAFKAVAPILLIIAGSGALKQIMVDSGTSKYIGGLLTTIEANPLITGWLIAAILRVCIGSATVAGLTAATIIMPLMVANPGVSKELMVLAVGSGSLMFSHINDGGFWLFKEYFNLSIIQTIKTWSIMETIVSIMGLLGVLVLDAVI